MASTIEKRPKKKKRQAQGVASAEAITAEARLQPPWYATTFAIAVAGAVLLYLAFPPVNWWPLAWIAPVPWLLLARLGKLPGRRPYGQLYLVGFVHWLVLLQWVRLGHWAAYFGWFALSLYLACYVPLFIGLTRAATHRLRVPLFVSAPIIWVGLETIRGWLFTGLSIALLGHTQIHFLHVVQISDLGGAYLVSFLVMLVAAAVAEAVPLTSLTKEAGRESPELPAGRNWSRYLSAAVALVAVVATLVYGHWRLGETRPQTEDAPARIALIQGSIDTNFYDPDLNRKMLEQYRNLTAEAHREKPDAILWPESVMPRQFIEIDRSGEIQKGLWLPQDEAEFNKLINDLDLGFRQEAFVLGYHGQENHIPLLVGAGTLRLGDHPPRRLNSAIFVDERGRVVDAYHKLHPVMFGEYAPGGRLFPWIYDLMPFPEGLTAGEEAKSFEIAGLQMSPSICYENTVPHLMRRQVAELRQQGIEPDVLVTLSNDGWFYGSAELDMHLNCGQFRAIELRKPSLVAANTGFSAHIGDDGRLLARGPRRATEVVMTEVRGGWRESYYARWGDVFANGCMILCFAAGVGGWLVGRRTAQSIQP